jgi:cyclopropane fatty-acyl-phospholipid synthase-like methyltransferase
MRCLAGALLLLSSLPAFSQDPRFVNKLAPFVASPTKVVDLMLEMAKIKPGETLYDLGSGDGRIVIAAAEKYKAKAVGVEISPKLVASATENIQNAGLANRARVIQGDVFQTDFSGADVVTMYLDTQSNARLKPNLEKYLKPGARIVSHDYPIPGWKPADVEKTGTRQEHTIYLYEIPVQKQ